MTTPNNKNATQNNNNKNNILNNTDNIFPDIIAPPPSSSSSTKNKTATRTTIAKTTTVIPPSANFPSFPSTPSSSSSSSSNKKSPFASLTKSLSQSSQSSSNRKPPQRQQSGSGGGGGGGGRKWSKYPGANIQKQTSSKTTTKQPSSSSKQQQQPPKSSSPKRTKKHPPPPPPTSTTTTTTKNTKVHPLPSTIYLRNYLPPPPAALSSSLSSLVESEICQRTVSEEEFLSLSVRQKRKIGDAFDRMNTPVLLQIVMPDNDDDVDSIVESQEDEKGKNNETEEEENVKQENDDSSDSSSNTEEKEQKKKNDLDLKKIDKAEKKKKKKKKDKIIYEAASSASSSSIIPLHPHWDYINEQCRFFDPEKKKKNDFDKKETNEKMGKRDSHKEDHDRHKKGNDNNNEEKETKWKDDTYQSLKIRVLVNINFQTFAHDDKKNNTSESSSSSLLEPILLAEIPIHPTQLRRLPPTTTTTTTPPSSFTIPNKLPPNSIIVQYTDNTLRVHPQLYHHLLSKKVIQECRTDENVMEDIMEEHKRTRRFDDDVFDILDGAGGDEESQGEEETGGKEEASLNSPSRLLGDVNGTTGGRTTKNQNGAAVVGGRKNNSSAFSNDDLFDLLGTTDDDRNDSKKAEQQQQDNTSATTPTKALAASTENGTNAAEKGASSSSPPPTTTPAQDMVGTRTESQIHSMELQKQVNLLRKVLKEEEESLEMDRDLLCREMEELKLLLEQEQDIEKETLEIQEHTKKEVEHLAQAEFILEARRVKLLRDLRQIYPIRAFPDNTFAIRGIKLPTDILDPAVPDEIVSTALGFACHLVFMCSKYLAIPLRYRLICNSSRSAVQDDGNGVFPLFKERVIDLKQLERAVILLERDIECLLYTRGISFSPLWHMLAKLDQLFERTTKGGGINP